MITRHLLGIYVDRDSLQYVSVVKGLGGLRIKSPGAGIAPEAKQMGRGYLLLREFLRILPQDRKRQIYLTLPRSQVFVRTFSLPAMAAEDALSAIQSSLALHVHLAPDEIFYDIQFFQGSKKTVEGILYYAPRGEIEKIQKLFSDAGHLGSLTGIFPLSHGLAALWEIKGGEPPRMFCLDQEGVSEVGVASREGLLFTMTSPVDGGEERNLLLKTAQAKFPETHGRIYSVCPGGEGLGEDSLRKLCRGLPPVEKNLGSAAVAPSLVKFQELSLDEKPVKIKIFRPGRYLFIFLILLVPALYFMTDSLNRTSLEEESLLLTLKEEVAKLESHLAPIQEKIETLKKAAHLKEDVRKFMETRPEIYTLVNELATLVPEDTWFSSFSFTKGKIVLRGRGPDALKTVELLRKSPLFETVMLQGSVNRSAQGEERFTIILKPMGKNGLGEKHHE